MKLNSFIVLTSLPNIYGAFCKNFLPLSVIYFHKKGHRCFTRSKLPHWEAFPTSNYIFKVNRLCWMCLKVNNLTDFVVNLFLADVPFLYPLKIPENLWFSGVFRGYKMGALTRNGLTTKIWSQSAGCCKVFVVDFESIFAGWVISKQTKQ